MMNELDKDFTFANLSEQDNALLERFNSLQNLSVEYPELIYDGPFSDGLNDREVKGLTGASINSNQAEDIFNAIFANYKLQNVKSEGETNGYLECFNVQGEINGDILYAQISKVGGKLIMFSYAGSCRGVNYSDDEAIQIASEFLTSIGVENMKPVWINLANNVYTINFAGEQNGVIIYGDLIKVRVCAETNMVIGIEAKSYYTNHTLRDIGSATLSQSQAQAKLLEDIVVESARKALVPIGNSSEKLCYEFSGEIDGSTYYIYIDANSGRQVEMFKVIKSTEGTLLM
jgi:germination protein YpeB